MSDNDKWLRKQCSLFLDSKLNDVILFEKAGFIMDAAKKRGISDSEVSEMYGTINKERRDNEN